MPNYLAAPRVECTAQLLESKIEKRNKATENVPNLATVSQEYTPSTHEQVITASLKPQTFLFTHQLPTRTVKSRNRTQFSQQNGLRIQGNNKSDRPL